MVLLLVVLVMQVVDVFSFASPTLALTGTRVRPKMPDKRHWHEGPLATADPVGTVGGNAAQTCPGAGACAGACVGACDGADSVVCGSQSAFGTNAV